MNFKIFYKVKSIVNKDKCKNDDTYTKTNEGKSVLLEKSSEILIKGYNKEFKLKLWDTQFTDTYFKMNKQIYDRKKNRKVWGFSKTKKNIF